MFLKVFQGLPTRNIYNLSLDYQPCTLGVDRNKMLSRCSVLNFYTTISEQSLHFQSPHIWCTCANVVYELLSIAQVSGALL
jgi:hypothetical protein